MPSSRPQVPAALMTVHRLQTLGWSGSPAKKSTSNIFKEDTSFFNCVVYVSTLLIYIYLNGYAYETVEIWKKEKTPLFSSVSEKVTLTHWLAIERDVYLEKASVKFFKKSKTSKNENLNSNKHTVNL